jgi:hypothetical protein
MDLATLFVRFKADTTDVEGKVKSLEATSTKSAGNIAKTLASAFSAAAIGAGIKKSIDAASDLNETVSKTNVIFGDAAGAIEKTGDTAAKSMGLSKTAYLDAASGLKGLLDNLGLTKDASVKYSQQLVQLGSDLGSFFNKDPAEALDAIQSALRGESEPIRAFNVQLSDAAIKQEALKEGLYDGVGAIDSNAKAQATLALIMQQTTAAQGDFARTSDGAANSQRIAKAEATDAAASFGQVLLPAYTKVVQVVGDVVHVFGELPGPVQTAIIALIGLVALAGPIGSFIEVVSGIKEALGALSLSTGGIALVAAAVAGLAYILADNDDRQAQISTRSKEVATSLSKETDEIAKQRQEAGQGATAAQAYADAQLAMSNALTGSDENGQKLTKALGALGVQTSDAAKLTALLQVNADQFNSTIGDGTDKAGDAARAQRDLAVAFLEQKGITADVARVLVEAGQGASFMGHAADVTTEQTKGWSVENKALLSSIIEVGKQAGDVNFQQAASGTLNAAVASSKYRASLVEQAEAQAGASRSSDQATAVLTAYQGIVDNLTPAQQKLFDATNAQATAFDDYGGAVITTANAVNDLSVQLDGLGQTTISATQAATDQAAAQFRSQESADDNAAATKKLNASLDDNTTAAQKARKAADDFGKALDDVFGSSLDLEEANRNIAEGFDKVTQSIKDNGNTLDINTEKGRNNRTSIEDQVKTIKDKIQADIASGVSVADATATGELYRQKLIQTSGSTDKARAAAEDYINQLGLTPENISTAVQLTNDEATKGRLQGLLTQLGDIDAGAAAKIQAEIDNGSFAQAEEDIKQLTRPRTVFVSRDDKGSAVARTALGRYAAGGSNILTTFAETPGRAGDEVAFPLGNPARIRELWGSNDVGSRIASALGAGGASGPQASTATTVQSSSSSSITGLHVEHLEIHDDTSAQSLAQIVALKMAGV